MTNTENISIEYFNGGQQLQFRHIPTNHYLIATFNESNANAVRLVGTKDVNSILDRIEKAVGTFNTPHGTFEFASIRDALVDFDLSEVDFDLP